MIDIHKGVRSCLGLEQYPSSTWGLKSATTIRARALLPPSDCLNRCKYGMATRDLCRERAVVSIEGPKHQGIGRTVRSQSSEMIHFDTCQPR